MRRTWTTLSIIKAFESLLLWGFSYYYHGHQVSHEREKGANFRERSSADSMACAALTLVSQCFELLLLHLGTTGAILLAQIIKLGGSGELLSQPPGSGLPLSLLLPDETLVPSFLSFSSSYLGHYIHTVFLSFV